MQTISIKLTDSQIKSLIENNPHLNEVAAPQYASHKLSGDNVTIVVYESKKVVFQGVNATKYADPFLVVEDIILPQAGSDETGTGSYFGPMVVCACYIDEDIYQKIKKYKLADSKQVNDQRIMDIAPYLIELVPHSLLVLDNKKYNELQKTQNQNKMLAKMHNKAFLNLEAKGYTMPNTTVIDQFTPKKTYYNYLSDDPIVFDRLIFETKAENKYISVACASIIARYAYLVALMQLSKYYNFTFLSGAGDLVDQNGRNFLKTHDINELNNVAKVHFANTKKITG